MLFLVKTVRSITTVVTYTPFLCRLLIDLAGNFCPFRLAPLFFSKSLFITGIQVYKVCVTRDFFVRPLLLRLLLFVMSVTDAVMTNFV